MNLALDIGNTAVKWATFEGRTMTGHGTGLPSADTLASAGSAMACASGDTAALDSRIATLGATTPLPISLDYRTPHTLGPDRIAATCGARALHPADDCLVIDAGTCVTVDFLDRTGIYHGGAILPGLSMNLQALHTFTAKLPLIDIEAGRQAPVLGRSTEESIVAGTLGAMQMALAGFVALYRQKCPALRVLVSGGDAERLLPAGTNGSEQVPLLTLIGLNEIMIYNEK